GRARLLRRRDPDGGRGAGAGDSHAFARAAGNPGPDAGLRTLLDQEPSADADVERPGRAARRRELRRDVEPVLRLPGRSAPGQLALVRLQPVRQELLLDRLGRHRADRRTAGASTGTEAARGQLRRRRLRRLTGIRLRGWLLLPGGLWFRVDP